MNRDDAMQCAELLTRSWPPGSISIDVWIDEFAEMHRKPVEATIRQLRASLIKMPSIAEFRSAYAAQFAPATPAPRVSCTTCGGDGWRTRSYYVGRVQYSATEPCGCQAGNEHRAAHKAAVQCNDAQLAALGYRLPVPSIDPPPPPDVPPRPPRKEPLL